MNIFIVLALSTIFPINYNLLVVEILNSKFVWGSCLEVLIFIPQDRNFYLTKGPVIHRVVNKWKDEDGKFHFQTKGDHNSKSFENFENDIIEDNVLAVSAVRIPYLGYVKIVLTNVIFFVSGHGGI